MSASIKDRYKQITTELVIINREVDGLEAQLKQLQKECPHNNMLKNQDSEPCPDCGFTV